MGGTEPGPPCPALAERMRAADERRAGAKPDPGCASSLAAPAGWPERGPSGPALAARIPPADERRAGARRGPQGGRRRGKGRLCRGPCALVRPGSAGGRAMRIGTPAGWPIAPRRHGGRSGAWARAACATPAIACLRAKRKPACRAGAGRRGRARAAHSSPPCRARAQDRVQPPSHGGPAEKGTAPVRTGPEDGRDSRVRPAAAAARRRAA